MLSQSLNVLSTAAFIAVPDAKKASVWGKGTSVNGQAL